jgi:hypothetical protein
LAFSHHADVCGARAILCGEALSAKIFAVVHKKIGMANAHQLFEYSGPSNSRTNDGDHENATYLSDGNCMGFHPP